MNVFVKEYDHKADAIVTNAIVLPASELREGCPLPPYIYTENAAWDTGAQVTIISPRLVEKLGLMPCGQGQFMGIGGDQVSDSYLVYVGLSNGDMIGEVKVYCSDIDDYDILLGMDIITETDFLITNKDGKTTFQFRSPSEGSVELQ